jgi:hypothetical protein
MVMLSYYVHSFDALIPYTSPLFVYNVRDPRDPELCQSF